MVKQKLIRTQDACQGEVNKLLDDGWIVKDFKPLAIGIGGSLGGSYGTFCYVLLEKEID